MPEEQEWRKWIEREVDKLKADQPLPEENIALNAVSKTFYISDKDKDRDYDPLTSTSWDGDAFSTGTGTINWNSVFGVPKGARAIVLNVTIRDSAGDFNTASIWFKAKSTTTNDAFQAFALEGFDRWNRYQGVVPIADDGTTYYDILASGVSTCDIILRVVGWYL